MRGRVAGLVALAAMLTGCGHQAAKPAAQAPAATAGRACQVLEYDAVASATGVRFDTAGGAQLDETFTCVLGITGHTFPDLTLALSATTADELIFVATVRPSGAVAVADLGVAAYQLGLPPVTAADGTASGPGVELGWLSLSRRLVLLRYRFANDAAPADVDAFTPGLLTLAHEVERALTAAS